MAALANMTNVNKRGHWGKPIANIFSSANVSDNFPFSIKFIGSVQCKQSQVQKQTPFYFLVTEENEIHALAFDTVKSDHFIKIPENIIHWCQVLPYAYVITLESGKIKLVTNFDDHFETKSFEIENVAFTIPCDDKQFVTIANNCSAKRVEIETGNPINIMMNSDETTNRPIDACVLQTNPQIVAVISDEYLFCGSFGTEGVKRHKIGKDLKKIGFIQPNSLFIIGDDGMAVYALKVDKSCSLEGKVTPFRFEEKMSLMYSRDPIFAKQTSSKKNLTPQFILMACNRSIATMDSRNLLLLCQIPEGKVISHILQIPSIPPNIIAVACEDGSITIVRMVQDVSQKDENNYVIKSFEKHELENFHKSKITALATAFELTFMSIDENGKYVIWESFPDWWCAPFYFDMFKGMLDDDDSVV